jgi:hypothetical protein
LKRRKSRGRLWANGGENYPLDNSDYNYLTQNGGYGNVTDPPTANMPVKDTDSFIKNTQIFPTAGSRDTFNAGVIGWHGTHGHYWANTPANSTQGYMFRFSNTEVTPVYTSSGIGSSTHGHSIRCVRI